jgi:hypothetical protein
MRPVMKGCDLILAITLPSMLPHNSSRGRLPCSEGVSDCSPVILVLPEVCNLSRNRSATVKPKQAESRDANCADQNAKLLLSLLLDRVHLGACVRRTTVYHNGNIGSCLELRHCTTASCGTFCTRPTILHSMMLIACGGESWSHSCSHNKLRNPPQPTDFSQSRAAYNAGGHPSRFAVP